jgi:hypothetical protein
MTPLSPPKGSPIDVPKLVAAIAQAYNVAELKGFLSDYFQTRLDHIINPVGVGFVEIVRAVVDHFDRRHALTDFIREIQKDRPGSIDLLALLLPRTTTSAQTQPSGTPPPSVDIEPEEVDFYFVIEPDRRTVPVASSKRPTNSIYVRIPAVSASALGAGGPLRAMALAVDRSGSMTGGKIDVARGAANYLLDLAEGTAARAAIVAFDDQIGPVVSLQPISQSAPYKAQISTLTPRGGTDLFAAWQRAVRELRAVDDTWDRRAVLITDGQMNKGMVDPVRFEREVHSAWKLERIATSCISMGDDWNVDLLNKLAAAGGGSIHFMKDAHQAEQALHEAFHAAHGVIASNLRIELEPVGSAKITQIQGAATSLCAGTKTVHHMATQLRTNVEECLVLRIEFTPPEAGQMAELLRCKLLYDDVKAVTRATPEKLLRVYADDDTGIAGQTIAHQGVVCTAHTMMSRQLFKEALGSFLHGDAGGGQALLAQARFTLETAQAPRGYHPAVSLQGRRIQDLERFEGRVPADYIKERYIEELAHRDVVWMKLCEVLDRITTWRFDARRDVGEAFLWADRMVDELAASLPIQTESGPRHGEGARGRFNRANDDVGSAEQFWLERARTSARPTPTSDRYVEQHQSAHPSLADETIALVAGACLGFERRRQGTRTELVELMDGYLQSRLHNAGRLRRGD